jgi:hypothetical protein
MINGYALTDIRTGPFEIFSGIKVELNQIQHTLYITVALKVHILTVDR